MTQSNNDIEELEELLTELEGQEAQLVRPYGEDDDAVTRLMDAPLGDQEWMVQVTALDRRMMSQDNVLADLRAGKLSNRTLVWRGGMEDWLPIARVDSLSRAAGPGSFAPGSLPAPPVRLAAPAPAPLQAPAMWSQTMPSAAPLPPPPSAMAPAVSSSPRSVMPMNGMGLPPAAAAPMPSPPSSPSLPPPEMMSSGNNTSRPVAIDFSDMVEDTRGPLRGKRAVMALSAVAILAVFISVYAMSSKTDGTTASAEPSRADQPRSVAALQPATEKKSEPSAAAAARPAAPAQEVAKPSESETDSEALSGSSSARANAPARYSPRSEYRRRSRGGSASERASEEPEATEAPTAAATASRAPAPAAAEEEPAVNEPAPVAAADDDADAVEAPKSTGKAANTFNREAAKSALDDAAGQAKNCRPAGGPSGTGRVQVRYEPSGKVSNVSILTGKFENTTTGSCVKMLFRRAKVPEFTGVPVVVVNKSFEIP